MWGSCFFLCTPARIRPPDLRVTHSQHTHTPLFHTQLCHTTLWHTSLWHNFVTHLSFTPLCLTPVFHTHLCHTPLFHTPFAHNFVIHSLTHTTLLHTTLNSQVSTVKTEVFFCIFSCLCKTASTAGEPFTETVTSRFSLDFAFYWLVFCLYRENKHDTNQPPKTQLNRCKHCTRLIVV